MCEWPEINMAFYWLRGAFWKETDFMEGREYAMTKRMGSITNVSNRFL